MSASPTGSEPKAKPANKAPAGDKNSATSKRPPTGGKGAPNTSGKSSPNTTGNKPSNRRKQKHRAPRSPQRGPRKARSPRFGSRSPRHGPKKPKDSKIQSFDTDKNVQILPSGEHKLQSEWTLHFDKKLVGPTAYRDFEENLVKLGSFDTLEGFWSHYEWMKRPDQLPRDYDMYMFRDHLKPAWETFPTGGCWILRVKRNNGLINRLWEELVFSVIGELFEEPDLVGVVLSTRGRDDNLSIWNRNINPETQKNIGERLKDILNLDQSTTVEYKKFHDALQDGSTFRNAKQYVYAAVVKSGNKANKRGKPAHRGGGGQSRNHGGKRKGKR